ncbi:rRNA maturation RNase YbeY [Patescibacteria group bacterium]|nr:rRNA maturation RNase YbeY [Patescibacteria group bacterium]
MRKFSPARFTRFKNAVLGRDFDCSFTYLPPARMRAVNRAHRGIDAATDILSFRLSDLSGEVLLCEREIVRHAREWGVSPERYLPYLVIHGLVHIKGFDHGAIMDTEETHYCRALGVTIPQSPASDGTAHRSRHRRRDVPGTRSRRAL